jgi:predicted metal-dependent hydrolase
MNLSVKADGQIRVSCNLRRSQREIHSFVESCSDFIARRRRELSEIEAKFPTPRLLSGERFLWRGCEARMDVIWGWKKRIQVTAGNDHVEILAPLTSTTADRQKALIRFFRAEAELDFARRVEEWGRRMGLVAKSLTIRGQKTLWGSCTGPGDISLNWKLLCAPSEVIDYVVIHELAHIPERNHSPRFWRVVAAFSPQHLAHRKWLRLHERQISRQFPK